MYLERARTLRGLYAVLDVLGISIAFVLAYFGREWHDQLPLLRSIPSTPWAPLSEERAIYTVLLIVSMGSWIWGLRGRRRYMRVHRGSWWRIFGHHLRGLGWAILATSAVVFALKFETVSRLYFGYYFAIGFVALMAKDLFLGRVLRRLMASQTVRRHALVIGSGQPASWFTQVLSADDDGLGRPTVGVLTPDDETAQEIGGQPVLGRFSDLDRVLVERPVDEVFIVGSARQLAELAPTAQTLIERGRIVSFVATLQAGPHGVSGRVTEFAGIPMVSYGPMPRDPVSAGAKRVLDAVVAGVALVVLSPLFLVVAVLLKLLDPGPALFHQDRLARGGQLFKIHKFRTMRVNAEALLRADEALYQRYVANDFKLPEQEDPRVSKLGLFLRKSSLDELPQLWNVLVGEMSLVGPRPIVPAEIDHYRPYADLFLSVRPGVTGYWQVSGRSNVRYPERAFLDLDYIAHHRLTDDLSILFKTLPAVLLRKGAH
jgi:exopolysaccharide production protein ExoY